jgi:hypothetical protein
MPDLFVVENVSWRPVPLGGGPADTGFDPNMQEVAAGSPEQLSVNTRFEPGAPNSVKGILRLCPAVTVGGAEGGTIAAMDTVSIKAADALVAEFMSPP